ncbi:hypothetical protein ACLB2K_017205 [Fragaria x ananassa]
MNHHQWTMRILSETEGCVFGVCSLTSFWSLPIFKSASFDIRAANFLDIKGLLDLTAQAVADMIKGKNAEEIREQFNIKNDYTPEEEEEVRRENQWAFEEYEEPPAVNEDSEDENHEPPPVDNEDPE